VAQGVGGNRAAGFCPHTLAGPRKLALVGEILPLRPQRLVGASLRLGLKRRKAPRPPVEFCLSEGGAKP